jgi:hypothetical protein
MFSLSFYVGYYLVGRALSRLDVSLNTYSTDSRDIQLDCPSGSPSTELPMPVIWGKDPQKQSVHDS